MRRVAGGGAPAPEGRIEIGALPFAVAQMIEAQLLNIAVVTKLLDFNPRFVLGRQAEIEDGIQSRVGWLAPRLKATHEDSIALEVSDIHHAIQRDAALAALCEGRRLADYAWERAEADATLLIKSARYRLTYLTPADTL